MNLVMNEPEKYHLNIANNIVSNGLDGLIQVINTQFLNLGSSTEKTLLISGEGISTLKVEELEKLKDKLSQVSVREAVIEIHYFTRKQNDYISSIIQERLKGGTKEEIILSDLAMISPLNNFINLNSFKLAFPYSTITKHQYENACQYEGGLEAYFLENILNITDDEFQHNSTRINSGLSNISFQLIRHYIDHSKKYVRIPIENSSYNKNIKTLALVKGERFFITNEQKNILRKATRNKLNFNDWRLFFEGVAVNLEQDCWLNFDVIELKKQLDAVDIECLQILVNFFREMALKIENEHLEAAFRLMHLAHYFRPEGKFILMKMTEYSAKLKKDF